MEQNPHVSFKLTFTAYKLLVELFNKKVKMGKYNSLSYQDYRLIQGKFFPESVTEVVIEFIDKDNFIIVFLPTNTTIYSGKVDDGSFGSFIKDFFKEKDNRPMIEKNNKVEKNNTYDLWGDSIDGSSLVASKTESADSFTYPYSSDYAITNRIVSNDSNSAIAYSYDTTTAWHDVDRTLSRVDNLEERVKVNEVKTKEEIDYIRHLNEELSEKVENLERDLVPKTNVIIEKLLKLEDEKEKVRNIKYNKREDNEKTMNTNKMFNFDFGFVDSNIRMSPYGMAVRNADGRYVSYDAKTGSVIDVEPFNFEGHHLMMKMPVAIKDVAVGDIVIHNHKPMFVVSTGDKITAIDIYNGEEKTILLTKSMFGFDFVVKVISFINFSGASAENPFGNMWPLFMLSDHNTELGLNGANGEMDVKSMFMLMAVMGQMSGSPANLFQNPMFLFAFLNDNDSGNSDMKDLMMFMAFASAMNTNSQPVMVIPPVNIPGTAVNPPAPNPSSTC